MSATPVLARPVDAFAATAPGLEGLLEAECRALGLHVVGSEPGGVSLRGSWIDVCRANLELGLATRVLVRVATFRARVFPELERHARSIPWGDFVAPGAGVTFDVTSRKSRLYHRRAIEERLRRAAGGLAPEGASTADDAPHGTRFVVRVFRDRFTVSADASGVPLHRRGYRQETAKAPLRETLAAALVVASGWTPERPFVDPFCGAGTVLLEAARTARRMAPGLGRSFACEAWPIHDAHTMREAREAARARVLPACPAPLVGFDRDAGAVRAAMANAERAGVAADVHVERRVISDLPASPGAALVTNPPYGTRVGEVEALRDLYARLGGVLRERCPDGDLTLLIAHDVHARALGLPVREMFRTSNGGIRVRCVGVARFADPVTGSA